MKHRRSQHAAGFTLIELMIAVTIVAILVGIAIPSYRSYVVRGQLQDGVNALAAMRANMERFYQDNRTYATVGAFKTPCETPPTVTNFTLSCVTTTATTFQVLAQGNTGQLTAFKFTVDQLNNKTTLVGTGGPTGFVSCANDWWTKQGACP
jgi:prepilin-type N-terminal cleavage/methylation domain-containing protein